MDNLPEFIAHHPILVMAFLGILGTLGWTFSQGSSRGLKRLSPQDVTRLINREDAVVLDVRGDGEFREGHIINAVHVPHDKIEQHLDRLKKYRSRPIIATCRTGQQSARAGSALRSHGFENVHHLSGGLVAWEGANLPLVKG